MENIATKIDGHTLKDIQKDWRPNQLNLYQESAGKRYRDMKNHTKYLTWVGLDRLTVQQPRYRMVCLTKGGKQSVRLVHQLVLEAFVGPRPAGMESCHENDDGFDNRLENLSWGTRSKNILDQVRNGIHVSNVLRKKGEKI